MFTALWIIIFAAALYGLTMVLRRPKKKYERVVTFVLMIPIVICPMIFIFDLMPIKQGAIPANVGMAFYIVLIVYLIKTERRER